jgi:putative peptidoglycan lipid II flippase
MALTIALCAPFFVIFVAIPELIMRGVFMRGAFDENAAMASASVLMAYGCGLPAIVLIRAAVASFQARGDTTTPMLISLFAFAVNIGLKIVLFTPYGAPGLAIATSVGAWINLLLLSFLAMRKGDMRPDATTIKVFAAAAVASAAMAIVVIFGFPVAHAIAADAGRWKNELELLAIGLAGGLVYVGVLVAGLLALGVRLRHLRPVRRSKIAADAGQTTVEG